MDVKDSMYLNWMFKYNSLGIDCTEYVFISKVNNSKIILNEESIDFKWCNLNELINLIQWYGDKNILKKVLEKALGKKLYFEKEKIERIN